MLSISEISVREILPLKNITNEEKPQFRENKVCPEKVITKHNKLIEKTIVNKPIYEKTVSPKKYIETLSPEKTQVIHSNPKYTEIFENIKQEYVVNPNYEDISTINDININDNINTNNKYNNNNVKNNINNIKTINNNNIKNNSNFNNNFNFNNYKIEKDINDISSFNDKNDNNKIIYSPSTPKKKESKPILQNNPVEKGQQQLFSSPKIEQSNKINKPNIQFKTPTKTNESVINNIFNYNSPIKSSKSFIQYNIPQQFSENIEFSPTSETRHVIEYSPLIINKPIIQYKNTEKTNPIIYSPSKIIQASKPYNESIISQPIPQYNQTKQNTKNQQLNYNNQYDLNSIERAKSYDIPNNIPTISTQYNNININYNIPYSIIPNVENSTDKPILNMEHYKNIQLQNMYNYPLYNVDSYKSTSSLSSHRSDLSIESQKTKYDKFGNPIYSASLHTPKKNKIYYQKNKKLQGNYILNKSNINNNASYSPPYYKRSLSQDEFKGPSYYIDNSPQSGIGTPISNKRIAYDINNINNINNNNYIQYQASIQRINPNNIDISPENKHIIDYYLNMNCKKIETFNPNAFNYFYPQNEKYFIIPKNEISLKQEISNPSLNTKYIGDVNYLGEKHGFGRLITPTERKIGTWRNGQFSGWGREIRYNGEVYEGKFKNGKINGKGIYKYRDILYIGDFENNIRQGKGEKITKNYYYKGDFNNDKIDGYGRIQFINSKDGKSEYEGFFKNNNIEGKGIMKWRNGNVYEGDVKNGKMNGYGRFIPNNGVPYNGYFKNGIRIDINKNNNNQNNKIQFNSKNDNLRY